MSGGQVSAVAAGAPIVGTRPLPGAVRPYQFPRFERRALDNGVQLLVAPMPALPLVTVHVVLDAGATRDPAGREGVALLTAELLAEGTRSLDGTALVDRFEQLGTALATGADWDSAWCASTVLAPRLDALLALLADVVRTPAFAPRELERLAAQRLAELLEQRAEPRGLADDMFARFAYAPGARFGIPAGGSETSVGAIARQDVVGFHTGWMTPASSTIVIAGDVTVDEARRLVLARFGDWEGRATAGGAAQRGNSLAAPDAESPDARGVHVIVKPDAPQSEVRVGHVAIPRAHPDWLPVHVMNAILGGLFSSRINLNLRERHAYTYGAFSTVDARRHAGTFDVAAVVVSHWILDFVSHRPDLPLWPGGPLEGLGLWNSIAATIVVEGALFAAAIAVYLGATTARDSQGRWSFWLLMAMTAGAWLSGPFSPPPPTVLAIAVVGLLMAIVFPAWAAWVERHRAMR